MLCGAPQNVQMEKSPVTHRPSLGHSLLQQGLSLQEVVTRFMSFNHLTFPGLQAHLLSQLAAHSADLFTVILHHSLCVQVRARNAAGFGSPSAIYRLNFDSTRM